MCGICGIADFNNPSRIDREVLHTMNESMTHRGPDDAGMFLSNEVGLAMRRLSIIDLEGGSQPISNEDNSITVVCNGEIYNSPALRRTLEHLGHTFKTHSDVETIIHCYEEYGDNFLEFLNGMFAFALWDSKKQLLIIARDRVGIKPLYYTVRNGTLLFGSELKVLRSHPMVSGDLDHLSLHQYLSFEYIPSPRTIYREVSKLPPGHMLKFSKKGIETQQYWNVRFERSESRPPLCWRDLREQFLAMLERTVQYELLSDVPVGVLLSGGLDSSAIAAMATRVSSKPIQSFTLQFQDASFDESTYAQIVSDRVGTHHHVLPVSTEMILDVIPKVSNIMDEPFGDSSIIPTYILTKFAREHVKVVLGGDGGDELFAGYPTLLAHRFVSLYETFVPYAIRAQIIPRLIDSLPVSLNNLSFDYKAKKFLTGRGVPMGERHHKWLGSFNEEEKRQLFHKDLDYSEIDTYSIVTEHLEQSDANHPMNQLLYCDQKLYMEGDILAKVDRASMANSLEVRVPLLNRVFFEFVSNLPFNMKLRRFTGKYVLKKAMRGILPDQIIDRKKKGFNIPIGKLFNSALKETLDDYTSPEFIKRQGLFNPDYIQRLVREHREMKYDHRKLLWTLMMFQQWDESNRSVSTQKQESPVRIVHSA